MADKATTATATETVPVAKKGRSASPFHPVLRLTISAHESLNGAKLPNPVAILESALKSAFAVRGTVHEPRKGSKVHYRSGMVYLAEPGFEWSAATNPAERIGKDMRTKLIEKAKENGMTVEEYLASIL